MTTQTPYPEHSRGDVIFALREALDAQGLNFSSFGREYGFDRRAVNAVAWRWYGTGCLPKGLISRRILRQLEAVVPPPAGADGEGSAACGTC